MKIHFEQTAMEEQQQLPKQINNNRFATVLTIVLSVIGLLALAEVYGPGAMIDTTPESSPIADSPDDTEPPFLRTPEIESTQAEQTAVFLSTELQTTTPTSDTQDAQQTTLPTKIASTTVTSSDIPVRKSPTPGTVATIVPQKTNTPTQTDMVITSTAQGTGNLFVSISDNDGILDYSIQLLTGTQKTGTVLVSKRMESISVRSLVIPLILPPLDPTKTYTLEVMGRDITGKIKTVRFASRDGFR